MLLYKWLTEFSRARGNAKAMVYRDTYLSWRGLQHRVERRAQEFAAMGVGKGHWVGIMLGNVPDFAILALAFSKLGATVVPLDPTLSARDLSLVLAAAPLRALITRPRGGVEQSAQEAARPVSANEVIESRRRLQGTLLMCSLYKTPKSVPGKADVVLFTNDMNGDPKGVLRTEENLEQTAKILAAGLEITPEDRILVTVPLFGAYGFDIGLVLTLSQGASLYLEDEVAPKRIVKLLKEQEINVLPGTPSLYAGLAKLPTAKPLKIKRARFLSSGSPIVDSTAEAFRARWGQRIISLYHNTESGPVACDGKGLAPTTAGKPFAGVDVKVPEGTQKNPAPIWVRSKAVSKQFIGSSATTKAAGKSETESGGWFRTGDLGYLDRADRIVLVGREDNLVKVEGRRVALNEVENCLETFPKVKNAKVRVVSDPLGGPVMVASVVVMGKCAAEDLIDHCAKNLAPYKVPRRIEFCAELPV